MAKKKKDYKRKEKLENKSALESLEFQTMWRLKQMGLSEDDAMYKSAMAEMKTIEENELTQDILSLKSIVYGVKCALQIEPVINKGDFTDSIVAFALGITHTDNIAKLQQSENIWQKLKEQKILSIYYPIEHRDNVVEWIKANGYTTSTYFGQPIVKLKYLYITIKHAL